VIAGLRTAAAVALAAAALLGVAGCRDGAATSTPDSGTTAGVEVARDELTDIETTLDSIDAEIAGDDAEVGAG